jgi:ATP-dependent Clp protease ATP-binding subunit ClpA
MPCRNYCVNLNKKAQQGKIDPLIGRDSEIERTIQILCRRTKNNPLYVGDPGRRQDRDRGGPGQAHHRGRRARGAAQVHHLRARHGQPARRHPLPRRLRGAAEGRRSPSSENQPGSILFIDEIHTVIGAGATSGGAMDASNLLKPALAQGTLRCIGSTTYKEYRNYFEKDRALVRRFQKIDVNEPSVEDAVKILQGLKTNYEKHHRVKYTPEAIRPRSSSRQVHPRPQAAGQGDRRDRRGRRVPHAAAETSGGRR